MWTAKVRIHDKFCRFRCESRELCEKRSDAGIAGTIEPALAKRAESNVLIDSNQVDESPCSRVGFCTVRHKMRCFMKKLVLLCALKQEAEKGTQSTSRTRKPDRESRGECVSQGENISEVKRKFVDGCGDSCRCVEEEEISRNPTIAFEKRSKLKKVRQVLRRSGC